MTYAFYPYWSESTPEFLESLQSQTVTYRLITRNRKTDKILWTKALRDFQKEVKRWQGAKDSDIIIIMNNDISFSKYAFQIAQGIQQGEVWIPSGLKIDWKKKKIAETNSKTEVMLKFNVGGQVSYSRYTMLNREPDSFLGRFFVMTLGDFKRIKFSRLLPHALADIDFGIRACKRLKPVIVDFGVKHKEHKYEPCKLFSLRSYENPILWTIFLLKHFNRWTFINIIKSWIVK